MHHGQGARLEQGWHRGNTEVPIHLTWICLDCGSFTQTSSVMFKKWNWFLWKISVFNSPRTRIWYHSSKIQSGDGEVCFNATNSLLSRWLYTGWRVGRTALVNSICRELVIDIRMLTSLSWPQSRSYCLVAKKKMPSAGEQVNTLARNNMKTLWGFLKLTCHTDCVKEVLIFVVDETWAREDSYFSVEKWKQQSLDCWDGGKLNLNLNV